MFYNCFIQNLREFNPELLNIKNKLYIDRYNNFILPPLLFYHLQLKHTIGRLQRTLSLQ